MEKTKRQKRIEKAVAIICALLLFLAFKAQGQNTKRVNEYNHDKGKNVICVYPTKPLYFRAPNSDRDTICLTIKADSAYSGGYSFCLCVNYPVSSKPTYPYPNLRIDFANGYTSYFEPIRAFNNGAIVEYGINLDALGNLGKSFYNHVVFEGVAQSYIKKNQDYFVGFFKEVLQIVKK